MEKDYILTMGEGEKIRKISLWKAFLLDEKCYFILLDLQTFDVMFGEYLGDFGTDMELVRDQIYEEFMQRCPNVTYVDGHLEDDLYAMMDEGLL